MLVSACFSVSNSARNLASSLNNLTAGRDFAKISRIRFKPRCPQKSPALPKSSPASQHANQILGCLPLNCEVLAAMWRRAFAARLRQPCGGEGSEGRALAIPRASGAGWAGVWVARLLRRDRPPPNHPRTMQGNWLSNDNGGAQGSTNTRRNHRRRNCSPAWLLAPRSAQRRRR
jgi:hypothetical protein